MISSLSKNDLLRSTPRNPGDAFGSFDARRSGLRRVGVRRPKASCWPGHQRIRVALFRRKGSTVSLHSLVPSASSPSLLSDLSSFLSASPTKPVSSPPSLTPPLPDLSQAYPLLSETPLPTSSLLVLSLKTSPPFTSLSVTEEEEEGRTEEDPLEVSPSRFGLSRTYSLELRTELSWESGSRRFRRGSCLLRSRSPRFVVASSPLLRHETDRHLAFSPCTQADHIASILILKKEVEKKTGSKLRIVLEGGQEAHLVRFFSFSNASS